MINAVLDALDLAREWLAVSLLIFIAGKVSHMSQSLAQIKSSVDADASLMHLRQSVANVIAELDALKAENADLKSQLAAATAGTVPDAALEEVAGQLDAALSPAPAPTVVPAPPVSTDPVASGTTAATAQVTPETAN